MEQIAAALGDGARWRIVELLAERPRSVGELAELTGLRQPQTTKHLQTLARVGLVTVFPLGQRRVYAVEAARLKDFEGQLRALIATIEANEGERDVLTRYQAAISESTAAADRDRWADGRAFSFDRLLAAPRNDAWRHWTEPALLASWWAPPSMTITDCVIEPWAGGRAVLDYRDAEGRYRSAGEVRAATELEHLEFDLSVLDAKGDVFFTGHYDLKFADAPGGTRLRLDLRITETTVEAVPFIAGIETGWGQVLDNLAARLTQEKD
ncbi:metalloregulator ArsR/SmtB family transcription factor [Amycolatopsis azurea]|uniref:ArsR family transcriptional regulator n=1 Tax=Amycolatopsis azurea DSM 43854 TaxID=1238180 RepID=M2NMC5_9PSEU|nr:metalloregulator ArsR/SmtB family transcription factor [Amycolatopsis azurea]EMD23309.1 putative glutathione S-transferase-related transmembrane protein [Amycolatopsis azurea DSM 43854]OOC03540.1 ArsR family transcriptional regulator [Amycolatopsis azurea DSM 43854]